MNVWLQGKDSDLVARIDRRIQAVTGLSIDTAEYLQVSNCLPDFGSILFIHQVFQTGWVGIMSHITTGAIPRDSRFQFDSLLKTNHN